MLKSDKEGVNLHISIYLGETLSLYLSLTLPVSHNLIYFLPITENNIARPNTAQLSTAQLNTAQP